MIITKYKKNCATPRLSDEEPDPMEQEDVEGISGETVEGWVPWSNEDMIDIRRIINGRLSLKQQEVVEAFLMGNNANDLGVTRKYWQYHLSQAIKIIQKEMGV